MRRRTVATLLVAGLIVVAGPASGQSRGGGRGLGGRVSGGGHSGAGGHVGFGGHGGFGGRSGGTVGRGFSGHPGGGPHGGVPRWGHGGRGWVGHPGWHGSYGWGGRYGSRGWYGWPGLYLGLPWWWDGGWGWGWPYDSYWYDSYPAYAPGSAAIVGEGAGTGPNAVAVAVPTSARTAVEFDVTPGQALVYLNGVLIGTVADFDGTSGFLDLGAGRYALEFRLAGYRGKRLELDVGGEAKATVVLDLEREPAGGAGAANPPAPGLPYGRSFSPSFGPAVNEPARQGRDGGGGQPAAPGSGMAAVRLRVLPANAAVYIDGVLIGTGEELGRLQRGVAVAPGAHRIDAVAPGRPAKSVQIEAEPGREQEVALDLD
jgi:hypothetical protein